MIKFTLVTVTYNAADTFMPTAESVLNQSYADVEHIIIDGASTDGTLQMARDYRLRNQQSASRHEIVIVSNPTRGSTMPCRRASTALRATTSVF